MIPKLAIVALNFSHPLKICRRDRAPFPCQGETKEKLSAAQHSLINVSFSVILAEKIDKR